MQVTARPSIWWEQFSTSLTLFGQIVEDEKQYAKIKSFRDELPHLKAVVMYGGESDIMIA